MVSAGCAIYCKFLKLFFSKSADDSELNLFFLIYATNCFLFIVFHLEADGEDDDDDDEDNDDGGDGGGDEDDDFDGDEDKEVNAYVAAYISFIFLQNN